MKTQLIFFFNLAIFAIIMQFPTSTTANIYVAGTDGYGLQTTAYSSPNTNSDNNPAPKGIVTTYNDAANATANGTMGTSFSSARIIFSVNADPLGLIDNNTTGVFSQTMFGSVSRPGGLTFSPVTYAFMNNVFGTFFITDSYYQYDVTTNFSNYTSDSTGHTLFQNTDTSTDIYFAKSDLNHTILGLSSGIISPGSYLFESSIILTASYPKSFDDNRITTQLSLTPIASPAPEPETLALFAMGIMLLFCKRKDILAKMR